MKLLNLYLAVFLFCFVLTFKDYILFPLPPQPLILICTLDLTDFLF